MKIVQLIYSLGNGGAEKFTVELCNKLSQNHEVVLVVVKPIEDWMIQAKKINVTVKLHELKCTKKYSLTLLIQLFSVLNKFKPDVLNVHSSVLVLYCYIISMINHKIKLIQTIHSTITPEYKKLFDVLKLLRFLKRHMVNVTISLDIGKDFKDHYPKLNFVTIQNGLNPLVITDKVEAVRKEINGYKNNADTIVFIAIGNYSVFKNFVMLTNVFRRLEEDSENVILLIIGGGPGANSENYAKVLELKGKKTFQLGLKDNVADYLSCADALVLSSTHEGMPLIVIEAFSIGIPVIATPAGGLKDMVQDGVNGLLINDFSEETLLSAVKGFINLSRSELTIYKENALKCFKEKYEISICAKKYVELYNNGR